MSKQDRQGARTPADLERKYQFGKRFAEIMGLVTDARGAVSEVESDLLEEILEQYTSLSRSTEDYVVTALKSYTKTGDLEDLVTTLRSEFSQRADEIRGEIIEKTEGLIDDLDKSTEEELNTIKKYFSFTVNGLKLGAVYIDPETGEEKESPYNVVIDNDDIKIIANGNEATPIQQFAADGTSLIPILKVTQMLSLLGLQITEDETHINCDYVGGVL